jgi:hypothetical protein
MAWLVVALTQLLVARTASAYPQFAFKGLGDCGSCHHSPTGGGLPNRWGRESLDVTFDTGVGWGNDDLAYDRAAPGTLKLDLGLDVRLLPLYVADGEGSNLAAIPMLTEVGGAAAVGRWMLYGTATTRAQAGNGPEYVFMSREHWLNYEAGSGFDVRLGRMVLPFGIRQPDHTQYVREDFEFDKYDQSYALEVDFRGTEWSVFGSLFAGDLSYEPRQRQSRGLAVTTLREFGQGAALGASAVLSTSSARNRGAGSLFGRSTLSANTYLLAEVAAQYVAANEGDAALSTLGEYLRLGWFARPELDVYLEVGRRAFLKADGLSKGRVGWGMNWQLLRWFELSPQVLAEARSDLSNRLTAMCQLHFSY